MTHPVQPATAHVDVRYPSERPVPGRGLGIAGFILSLLGAFSPIGLVLSIVSLVQAKRVGRGNGLAVAGIVFGVIGTVVLVVVLVASISALSSQTELCGIGDLIRLSCN